MDTLRVEETVRLNSGGPLMTVELLLDEDEVRCVWFEKNQPRKGVFPRAVLSSDDGMPIVA